MCFVTKGEKLLVEKDITLEDVITIKVNPVCTPHSWKSPFTAEGGHQRPGGCAMSSGSGEVAWMQGDRYNDGAH